MAEAPSYEGLQERLRSPQSSAPPAEWAFELIKNEDDELSFCLVMRRFRQVHFTAGSNLTAGAFVMLILLVSVVPMLLYVRSTRTGADVQS